MLQRRAPAVVQFDVHAVAHAVPMQRSLATGHAAGADTAGQPSAASVQTDSWVPEHEVSPSVHDEVAHLPAQTLGAPAHAVTPFAHGVDCQARHPPSDRVHVRNELLSVGEHSAAPSGLPSHVSAHAGSAGASGVVPPPPTGRSGITDNGSSVLDGGEAEQAASSKSVAGTTARRCFMVAHDGLPDLGHGRRRRRRDRHRSAP